MKKFKKLLEKPFAAYAFATCTAVLLFIILSNLGKIGVALGWVWKVLTPVVIGAVTAYLFNPVSEFFKRTLFKKVKKENTRHVLGVVMAVVCLVLVLAILLLALIPSLAQSISKLIKNWGNYTTKLKGVVDYLSGLGARFGLKINLANLTDNLMGKLFAIIKGNYKNILGVIGNVGAVVVDVVIGILFGFCFLIAKKSILNFFQSIRKATVREEKLERERKLLNNCNSIFLKYVGSTLLDAFIVAVCALILMLIFKIPFAPLIAVVIGLTNIIPTFGPMIGAAVGVFFTILESPLKALIFLIMICTLQSIDGMVLKPKLFSGSLGIPAVWTLVLITLGGKIAGMLGILLAIPFAAIFVIVYKETILPKLEARRIKINSKSPDNEEKLEE